MTMQAHQPRQQLHHLHFRFEIAFVATVIFTRPKRLIDAVCKSSGLAIQNALV
jgi:hypothetical protein